MSKGEEKKKTVRSYSGRTGAREHATVGEAYRRWLEDPSVNKIDWFGSEGTHYRFRPFRKAYIEKAFVNGTLSQIKELSRGQFESAGQADYFWIDEDPKKVDSRWDALIIYSALTNADFSDLYCPEVALEDAAKKREAEKKKQELRVAAAKLRDEKESAWNAVRN